MWLKNIVFTIILLTSYLAVGEDNPDISLTYQQMVVAIRSGDFQSMRSYHYLQEGLTFETLEKNWDRMQKTYESIYPSLKEITLIESLEGKKGSRYWIVELNAIDQGNKHIKSYKFTPDDSSPSGWKVSATRYSGSYTYPDQMGTRDKVVKYIEEQIMSE